MGRPGADPSRYWTGRWSLAKPKCPRNNGVRYWSSRRLPGTRVTHCSRPDETCPPAVPRPHLLSLHLHGSALSIDNLVVGFALGPYKAPIALAEIVLAVLSIGMSPIGFKIGDPLGAQVERCSSEIRGMVLMLAVAALASATF